MVVRDTAKRVVNPTQIVVDSVLILATNQSEKAVSTLCYARLSSAEVSGAV